MTTCAQHPYLQRLLNHRPAMLNVPLYQNGGNRMQPRDPWLPRDSAASSTPGSGHAGSRSTLGMLLLLLAGCSASTPETDHQARYRAMIGRPEADLIQSFGQPTRSENIGGHEFLTYEESDIWSGSRPTLGRHGSGATAFECRATFVLVAGTVSTYSISGSGC